MQLLASLGYTPILSSRLGRLPFPAVSEVGNILGTPPRITQVRTMPLLRGAEVMEFEDDETSSETDAMMVPTLLSFFRTFFRAFLLSFFLSS